MSFLRCMALLMVLGALGCQRESETEPIAQPPATAPLNTSLLLHLTSVKGGSVPGAKVLLPSGRVLTANADGQLLLEQLAPEEKLLLRVSAEGFAPSFLALRVPKEVHAGTRLPLLDLGEPITFDASDGLDVQQGLKNGLLRLTIPPGSLFDAPGQPVQGPVQLFLSALDLDAGELPGAPGTLKGHIGSREVDLESLGIISLVIKHGDGSDAGKVVSYAKRVKVGGIVTRGAVGSFAQAPSNELPRVPVWELASDTGEWQPLAETAQLEKRDDGEYEWNVELDNPPSLFNLALPYWAHSASASRDNPLQPVEPEWVETTCMKVEVKNKVGQPVAGRTVVAQGRDYMGLSRAVTDANGLARLQVMRAKRVLLDVGDGNPREKPTSELAGVCEGDAGVIPDEQLPAVRLKVPMQFCTPGARRDCESNPHAGHGVCRANEQYCDVGGMDWGNCLGEVPPQAKEDCDNDLDDDCNDAVNDSCSSVCEPGATRDCYGGDPGTRDQGVCHGGVQRCFAGGTGWSDCEGERLPEDMDHCAATNTEDSNCDGRVCVCWPGDTRSYYSGPGGTEGVGICRTGTEECDAEGTSWQVATSDVTPQSESCATVEDDDCNGQVNDDPSCVCMPGDTKDCYTGPMGTRDVGLCHGGTQQCDASGTAWGACSGDVTPQPQEDCTTPDDDDCDGQVNEGDVCVCVPNSTRDCYTGPAGTQNVGLCHGGTQQCDASGTAWGACTGEVTPLAEETCDNGRDDNCDGQTDEEPPCGWVLAGALYTAHATHTATLLKDGKVLVAGGFNNGVYLKTAQVYDPATNSWSSPPSNMGSTRSHHTATLLNNGKVLVVGGYNSSSGFLTTAEVYDPATDSWSSTTTSSPDSHPQTVRKEHTATLLGNGKVLISGGNGPSGPIKSAEVYDPEANSWSPISDMGSARANHTATLLDNGKVLVVGGRSSSNTYPTSTEVYDPATDKWSSTMGAMAAGRELHTATLLGNGKVLVAGGSIDSGTLATVKSSAEVYNPATDSWSSISDMVTARDQHTATLLGNGKVLVAGGGIDRPTSPPDAHPVGVRSAEEYDPATGYWSSISDMNIARFAHTATLLGNGKVFVAGGQSGSAYSNTAELYDTGTGTGTPSWSSGGPPVLGSP